MEATEVKKLIDSAIKPFKANIATLNKQNKALIARIEVLEDLNRANINLSDAIITIDTVNKTVKIETDLGNIETTIVDGTVKPPVVVDPFCKKAAEQYLKDNLDLAPNGVTIETARKHYEGFGQREGRKWKSELCK